jgi:hypothetical protein
VPTHQHRRSKDLVCHQRPLIKLHTAKTKPNQVRLWRQRHTHSDVKQISIKDKPTAKTQKAAKATSRQHLAALS